MARAGDRGDELGYEEGGEPRCEQRVPDAGLCWSPVDHACDACGKLVCSGHVSLARIDPGRPGEPRWIALPSGLPPEICRTCRALESWWGHDRVEEIDDEIRARFYESREAAGLVGSFEIAWLEARQGGSSAAR